MLKIKPGFSLRKIMDTYIVIGGGAEAYRPNCLMTLNDSGAMLWNAAAEGAERETLVELLLERYETDRETAEKDVDIFIAHLRDEGIAEDVQ